MDACTPNILILNKPPSFLQTIYVQCSLTNRKLHILVRDVGQREYEYSPRATGEPLVFEHPTCHYDTCMPVSLGCVDLPRVHHDGELRADTEIVASSTSLP